MRNKQLGWLPEAEGPGSGSSSGKAREHPVSRHRCSKPKEGEGHAPTRRPAQVMLEALPGQNRGQSHSPTTGTEDLHVTSW